MCIGFAHRVSSRCIFWLTLAWTVWVKSETRLARSSAWSREIAVEQIGSVVRSQLKSVFYEAVIPGCALRKAMHKSQKIYSLLAARAPKPTQIDTGDKR
jgi:hypothetical protein